MAHSIEDREYETDKESPQRQGVQTREPMLKEQIEYIPPTFKEILISISSLSRLLMSHTFFAWRTGISNRFLDGVLLPRLRAVGATVIVPLKRPFWLENLKNTTLCSMETLESQGLSSILSSGEFLYVFDAQTPAECFQIIEQVLRQSENEKDTNSFGQLIVLLEVFGPFDAEYRHALNLLMRDGLIKGPVLWLHAEVVNTPKGFLDQFHNHIILMPSRHEIDILSKVQPIPINEVELKGARHNVAIIGGDCLPTTPSWEIVNLSGNSETERNRERRRLKELLRKYENKRLAQKIKLTDMYTDERSATPDQMRVIEQIDGMIRLIEDELSKLS